MSKKELTVLVGLPGCGKSTFRSTYDWVISTDQFIERYAKAEGKTYNDVFEDYVKTAERLMESHMKLAINCGIDRIVWDQTNLSAKTRKRKLQQFNEAGGKHYRKTAIFFEPNLAQSIQRNEDRRQYGRNVPVHVLESMALQITVPSKEEGFDYVLIVPEWSQG